MQSALTNRYVFSALNFVITFFSVIVSGCKNKASIVSQRRQTNINTALLHVYSKQCLTVPIFSRAPKLIQSLLTLALLASVVMVRGPNVYAATFTSDTFTGTAGTALTAHTATDGSTWTAFFASGGNMTLNGSGAVYPAGNDFYYVSNAGHKPANDQFDVQTTVTVYTTPVAGNSFGIYVPYSNGGSTYWAPIWSGTDGKWELTWKNNGTIQTVTESSTSVPPTAGSTYVLKLQVRTASVSFLISQDGGSTWTVLFTRASNNLDSFPVLGVGLTGNISSNGTSTGVTFSSFSGTDYVNLNPSFSSAQVPTAGTTCAVTFTIPGTSPLTFGGASSTATNGGFTVTSGGVSNTVTSASISSNVVTLNLTNTVYSGQAVTVAYTSGGNGNLQDSAGTPNTVNSFSAQTVTNNSTQTNTVTGYSITPSPASGSTVAVGSAISLPVSFTGTNLASSLTITATLGSGLTGTFSSSTSGVTITGSSSPYTITVASGTYSSGLNLTFTPSSAVSAQTITFTHSGGGGSFAAGSDPGPFTYTTVIQPTFTVSQPHVYTNSVNDAMSAVGTNTSWTSGTTFSVSGGTGSGVVTDSVDVTNQIGTLKLTAGSAAGNETISDTTDSATATVIVQTPSQAIALSSGTLLIGNTVTITVTGTNTLYKTQVGTYFSLQGTAGLASTITNTTFNSDTSATLTIALGNATGSLSVQEVAPYGGGALSNSLTVTSSGGVITYTGKVTQTANSATGITLVAPTPSGTNGTVHYTWKRSTTAGFSFSTGTTVGTDSSTITDNPGTSGGSTIYYYKVQISDSAGDTPATTNNSDQLITTQWGQTLQIVGLGDSVMAGQNATTNFLTQLVTALSTNYGYHTCPYVNGTNNRGIGGTSSGQWLPTNTSTEQSIGNLATNDYNEAKSAWQTLSIPPTDIVVELMTNDIGQGITPTQYGTNMQAIITQLHTDWPSARIWLTDSPVYVVQPDTSLASCLAISGQMDTLCSPTGPLSSLVNAHILYRLDKTWPTVVGAQKSLYLSSDNVHPNNSGQTIGGQIMAFKMANALGLAGTVGVRRVSSGNLSGGF